MFAFDDNQREAVNKLKTGSILCGSVGSGKSRVSLAYFFEKECGGSFEPSYSPFKVYKDLVIITTAKKRDNHEWLDEINAFTMFADDIKKINITIDSWNNIRKYENVKNAFFIFDEQRLVGSGTWVTAFYIITGSGRYIKRNPNNNWILLSATPGDTWSDYIPVFVANKFYANKTEFSQMHIIYNPFLPYRKIDRYVSEGRLKMYRNSILVDIKVTKRERKVNWIKCDYDIMSYKLVQKNRWDIYENKPIKNAASYCYILRKIVNMDHSRFKALLNLFAEHKKMIVFYNFDYELEILRYICKKNNIIFSEWNGHKHNEIPDTDSWIYLVQYSAGAEGWNCKETNVIVFYSLNYSYKITEQSSGRIDRRDTPFDELLYYHFYSDAWIDRAIRKALSSKKNFNHNKFCKEFNFYEKS